MMTTMIDSFQLIQTQGEGGRVTDINNSINILLCGSEPRTSKSQLLRRVHKSYPRGRGIQVYTFEKGSVLSVRDPETHNSRTISAEPTQP